MPEYNCINNVKASRGSKTYKNKPHLMRNCCLLKLTRKPYPVRNCPTSTILLNCSSIDVIVDIKTNLLG